ncbi:ALF repeat-containing protein [Streptomyces sp. A 4/2]|uniref:ALF repeat-containing protein n=1 Tax=Streptomyces sp. A 4/2 TaxID=2934314 RepID=UPI002025585C|nr:ALF repeat-containing protein [Streptomyces sp. A 4/2]
MTQKAAGDTFTVDVSRSVIEGQAIVDETKALTAKANKSDTDEASLAVKGRAVALRALRYFGSWRQDAAAQALSGTDSDVAEYLRTGWDKAVADETRQQVADLASDSPYETVRTAADATLDGTDTEILDFYTTGQHQAAEADYRVAVTKLANDGGPGVKDDAKKALADGSTNALVNFLNKGRYASQQADERVTATQLYNDGGPEVRSAAKIALAGPADEVHQFVEAGQYMAAQKDRLDDTHLAQMQRLIAEGQGIAATARKNSAVAAQAAAVAGNAAFDAAQSKLDAERSAKDAEGYAAAADTAADHAETSAKQAKASAHHRASRLRSRCAGLRRCRRVRRTGRLLRLVVVRVPSSWSWAWRASSVSTCSGVRRVRAAMARRWRLTSAGSHTSARSSSLASRCSCAQAVWLSRTVWRCPRAGSGGGRRSTRRGVRRARR